LAIARDPWAADGARAFVDLVADRVLQVAALEEARGVRDRELGARSVPVGILDVLEHLAGSPPAQRYPRQRADEALAAYESALDGERQLVGRAGENVGLIDLEESRLLAV